MNYESFPSCEITEKAIIAEAILDGTLQGILLDVATTDFHFQKNAAVWEAVSILHEEQSTFNVMDVWNRLKQNPRNNMTIAEVLKITEGVPPGILPKKTVRFLKELSTKRQALRQLAQIQSRLLDNAPIPEVVQQVENLQKSLISTKNENGNFQSFAEVLRQEVYPRLDKFVKGESNRIKTGFELIDNATLDGIGTSELWIIAALTGEGKSAFALQIARQIAEQGISVACVSREMLNYENGLRALSQFGQFNNGVFRAGLNEQTAIRIKEVGEHLEVLPIFFDDKTNNIQQLKKNVSVLIENEKIQVLFIDYLQLIQSTSRESRQAKIEEIVNDLKDFAMQKEIGVVLLSQFNRDANKFQGLPKISDLDGASAIEKAGNVILLWKLEEEEEREFYGQNNTRSRDFRRGILRIAKGRHTPKSEFGIKFFGSETRFEVI